MSLIIIQTGLLSVTFRQLSARQIIELAQQAGLQAIEWGGDIHVPHGDLEIARQVGDWTLQAGLKTASYGSYYRAGCEGDKGPCFEEVLASAVALGAPAIRIWAGNRGTADANAAWRETVALDIRRVAEMAAERSVRILLEYHQRTLTDSWSSTVELLQMVDHTQVRTNWQPQTHESIEERLYSLQQVKPWLGDIHAFHWDATGRLPFSEGVSGWSQYLALVQQQPTSHNVMLEFVKDDQPRQLLEDAAALGQLCEVLEQQG